MRCEFTIVHVAGIFLLDSGLTAGEECIVFFFSGLFLGCAGRRGRMGVGMGMGMYHTVAGERGGIPHPYRRRGEETRADEGVNIKRNFFLVILSARC
jgi:hypothetical protein